MNRRLVRLEPAILSKMSLVLALAVMVLPRLAQGQTDVEANASLCQPLLERHQAIIAEYEAAAGASIDPEVLGDLGTCVVDSDGVWAVVFTQPLTIVYDDPDSRLPTAAQGGFSVVRVEGFERYDWQYRYTGAREGYDST